MAEHLPFLVAAYAIVWIGVLLYVAGLARHSRRLERDVEELRRLVEQRADRRDSGSAAPRAPIS